MTKSEFAAFRCATSRIAELERAAETSQAEYTAIGRVRTFVALHAPQDGGRTP